MLRTQCTQDHEKSLTCHLVRGLVHLRRQLRREAAERLWLRQQQPGRDGQVERHQHGVIVAVVQRSERSAFTEGGLFLLSSQGSDVWAQKGTMELLRIDSFVPSPGGEKKSPEEGKKQRDKKVRSSKASKDL